MRVSVRLFGVFRTAAGTDGLILEMAVEHPTVRDIVQELTSQKHLESLKELLVENGTGDPRPNALIMISGREINTLDGLSTTLTEADELALLPIAHGG